MNSIIAGQAAAAGIRRIFPQADLTVRPLADGGEGTAAVLTAGLGGRMRQITVTGPSGRPVVCEYGIVMPAAVAMIEMASAAGLTLLSEEERDPRLTTTYGVGEVIRDAVGQGCRKFIIGLGGSGTNDGGIGMLQALGFGLFNAAGAPVPRGAIGLAELAVIDSSKVLPELAECQFRVACDVHNPLCGETGCSVVFGPQKGAASGLIAQMDQWLSAYAALVQKQYPWADPDHPGAGAAGGMGFALMAFLQARLEPGVKIIIEETGLEEAIKNADYVITGEGRLDGQTVMGKGPAGVAALAQKYQRPVIALAGSLADDAAVCNQYGITAFFSIIPKIMTLREAMDQERAKQNMSDVCEQIFRLLAINNI